jgi:hypothetical protein
MTKLDKPVRRESYSSARERGRSLPICIELNPTFIRVKVKGGRRWLTATMDQLWTLANRNEAEARRREREAARAEKRKGVTLHISDRKVAK